MKIKKIHIGHRILWVLMALHIFNFSIDTPHTLFEHSTVDADFDEIDSVVELVLEDVLCIDDAIPENHTKTPITHKLDIKKVVWLFEEHPVIKLREETASNYKIVLPHIYYKNPVYNSPLVNIFSPPPEV